MKKFLITSLLLGIHSFTFCAQEGLFTARDGQEYYFDLTQKKWSTEDADIFADSFHGNDYSEYSEIASDGISMEDAYDHSLRGRIQPCIRIMEKIRAQQVGLIIFRKQHGFDIQKTTLFVSIIGIISECQNNGIGKASFDFLIKKLHPHTIALKPVNESIPFYKKIGFKKDKSGFLYIKKCTKEPQKQRCLIV